MVGTVDSSSNDQQNGYHDPSPREEWNMDVPDTIAALTIAGGCLLAVAAGGFAILAQLGAEWREATEEWWPDEVGAPEE
jgi:hypothetical protein